MIKTSCTYIWSRLVPAISRNDESRIQHTRFIRQACVRKSIRDKRKPGITLENRKTNNNSAQDTFAKTINTISQTVTGKDPNVDQKDLSDHLTSKEKENTGAPSSSKVEPPKDVQTKKSVDNETSAKTKRSLSIKFQKSNIHNSSCALINPSFPIREKKHRKSRIERYFEELQREQNKAKSNPTVNTSETQRNEPDNVVETPKVKTNVLHHSATPGTTSNASDYPATSGMKSHVLDNTTIGPKSKLEILQAELSASKLTPELPKKDDVVAIPSATSKIEALKAELSASNVSREELAGISFDFDKVNSILREKERLERELMYVKNQMTVQEMQKELIRPPSALSDVPFKSNIPEEPEVTSSSSPYLQSVPSNTARHRQTPGSQYKYPFHQSDPSLTSHASAPSYYQGTQSDSQLTSKKKDGIFKTLKNKLFFWRRKSKTQTTSAGGSVTHTNVPFNQTPQPNYSSSQMTQPSQSLTSQNYSVPAISQNLPSLPSQKYPETPTKRSLAAKYSNAVRDFTGRAITAGNISDSTAVPYYRGAKSSAPQSEPRSVSYLYAPAKSDPYKPQSVRTKPRVTQYSSQNSQTFTYKPLPLTVSSTNTNDASSYPPLPEHVILQPMPQSFGFLPQPQAVKSTVTLPQVTNQLQATNNQQSQVFNPLAFFSQPQYQAGQPVPFQVPPPTFEAAQPQTCQMTLPQPFQAAQPQTCQVTLPQPFQAPQMSYQAALPQSYQAAVNSCFPFPCSNQVTTTSSMYQFPTNARQTFIPQPAPVTPNQRFPYVATAMSHLKHPWYQTMQNSALMSPIQQYMNKAAVVMAPMNVQPYILSLPMSKQLKIPRAYQGSFASSLGHGANRAVVLTPQQPYYTQYPQYLLTQKRYV